MTVNLLYALPQTPLHDRLQKAGRIIPVRAGIRTSPFWSLYETVVERWRQVVAHIYEPANLFERFATQAVQTYPNRCQPLHPWSRLNYTDLKRGLRILWRIVWRAGICGGYRREFWRMFRAQLRRGNLEDIIQITLVAHHLITYAQACTQGKMQSSNYSSRTVENYR